MSVLTVYYQAWKRRRAVKAMEKDITAWIAQYRFPVEAKLSEMGIKILKSPTLPSAITLTFLPQAERYRVSPHVTLNTANRTLPWARQLALGMLYARLTVTQRSTPLTKYPQVYEIKEVDLMAPEGPSDNEQWLEMRFALDILVPYTAIRRLVEEVNAKYFNRTPYVLSRVFELDELTLKQRYAEACHGVTAPEVPQPPRSSATAA